MSPILMFLRSLIRSPAPPKSSTIMRSRSVICREISLLWSATMGADRKFFICDRVKIFDNAFSNFGIINSREGFASRCLFSSKNPNSERRAEI
jgi:hypothetical protein